MTKLRLSGIPVARIFDAIVVQTDAAGDEIGVKIRFARCANQIGQITPGERFASRKTDLQYT